MTIRPVDLNGMIQSTQDVSQMKQHEDAKPFVEQQNIQSEMVKQEEKKLKQVVHADDSNEPEYRYDAKEGGNGKYEQNGQHKKKKKQDDGQVKVKGMSGGFDIRI